MEKAFNEMEADFSKIGTFGGNAFLSRVEHKTYLKIDERGAEGAAVTAVGVGVTSLPPPLIFDRPFITMIYHKPSETLLFVGKIEDPSES